MEMGSMTNISNLYYKESIIPGIFFSKLVTNIVIWHSYVHSYENLSRYVETNTTFYWVFFKCVSLNLNILWNIS